MSNIEVGIIGAGNITKNVHLPVLRCFKEVHIAWAADSDPKQVYELCQSYNVNRQIILSKNGIKLPHCDVVLLATPVHARLEYLEYLAAQKVAIFTEKPFALSESEHKHYLHVCAGTSVACGFMRRTYASVQALKRIIKEGWFGKLCEIQYCEGGRVSRSSSSSKTLDMSYRLGGGVLRDLGCHGIDTLLYITEAKNFEIENSNIEWDSDTDRMVSSMFSVSGGVGSAQDDALVRFTVSWLTPQSNTILLIFEKAMIRAYISPEKSLEIYSSLSGGHWIPLSIDVSGAKTTYQAFYLEWKDVLESVTKGSKGQFAASSSLRTTRLVDAIYSWGRKD